MTLEAQRPGLSEIKPLSQLNQIEKIGLASLTGATINNDDLEFPNGLTLEINTQHPGVRKGSVFRSALDSVVYVNNGSAFLVFAGSLIDPQGEIEIVNLSTGEASVKQDYEVEQGIIDSHKIAISERELRVPKHTRNYH